MKIYSLPVELEKSVPQITSDFVYEVYSEAIKAHKAKVKEYLHRIGYTGRHTGKIYSTPVADGSAEYMVADGSGSFLLHLPYGDAYHDPYVVYLPKKEILKRIDARSKFSKLFGEKS